MTFGRAQSCSQAIVHVHSRFRVHVFPTGQTWQVRASIGPAPYWAAEKKTLPDALSWLAGEVRQVCELGLCDVHAAYQMLGWIARRQREHREDASARLGQAVRRSKEFSRDR